MAVPASEGVTMARLGSGQLHHSVTFSIITEAPDGHGGFDLVKDDFTTRAHFRFLRGSETVQAARLQGKQPVVVTVRRNSKTAQITTDTAMRDARTGTEYNIRAVVQTEDRQFVEITAESGVATP